MFMIQLMKTRISYKSGERKDEYRRLVIILSVTSSVKLIFMLKKQIRDGYIIATDLVI